jgi:excisionase family DNA binding protein
MPNRTAELPSADSSPLVFSVPQAARQLGVSPGLIWDLVHRGQIPSCRLGRRVLIPSDALRTAVQDLTRGGPDPRP